jgi:hypothetical protein
MRSQQKSTSVLEAIREGHWDFEPRKTDQDEFDATRALPGTDAKLEILARRIERGLPLWHPSDRMTYDDSEKAD